MGGILTSTNGGYSEKYTKLRNEIRNGDFILYIGTSFMAKSIQYFDNCLYNHIGVVWIPENTDRLLTIDMWSAGLTCLPVSRRMESYKDFCILRPKVSELKTKVAISLAIEKWDGENVKYDNSLCLRIAVIKKTGIDLTGLGKKDKFICSEFIQYYCGLLGLKTYANINLITPEDFRRYIDENFELIYDDAPAPDMSFKNKNIWHLGGNNYNLT